MNRPQSWMALAFPVVIASCERDLPTAADLRIRNSIPSAPIFVTAATDPRIAFQSNRDGNFEVYVMEEDGSAQTRLTTSPFGDFPASWSPDASKIAFFTNRDGDLEVYVMNADGTGQTRLTTNAAYDAGGWFSPDGTKIGFMSERDGNRELYVMMADGSGQTNLTNSPAFERDFSWSPDGNMIVFTTYRDGNAEIYVMKSDGTAQTRLTTNAAFDAAPSWSPDGARIAFTSDRDGNFEVYVMNADGTGQTRLTTNPGTGNGFPTWSPDGSKIAFNSLRDGNNEIYLMNVDGSAQANLTNNPALDGTPIWSRMPTLPNRPPVANAGPDRDGFSGDLVVFDAAGSSCSGGCTEFRWDFGDGSTATGVAVGHKFSVPNNYRVVLTVRDAQGQQATDEAVVSVLPLIATAAFSKKDPFDHAARIEATYYWLQGEGAARIYRVTGMHLTATGIISAEYVVLKNSNVSTIFPGICIWFSRPLFHRFVRPGLPALQGDIDEAVVTDVIVSSGASIVVQATWIPTIFGATPTPKVGASCAVGFFP